MTVNKSPTSGRFWTSATRLLWNPRKKQCKLSVWATVEKAWSSHKWPCDVVTVSQLCILHDWPGDHIWASWERVNWMDHFMFTMTKWQSGKWGNENNVCQFIALPFQWHVLGLLDKCTKSQSARHRPQKMMHKAKWAQTVWRRQCIHLSWAGGLLPNGCILNRLSYSFSVTWLRKPLRKHSLSSQS
jgi:hypothetical protein